jgi:hypothetical protein
VRIVVIEKWLSTVAKMVEFSVAKMVEFSVAKMIEFSVAKMADKITKWLSLL